MEVDPGRRNHGGAAQKCAVDGGRGDSGGHCVGGDADAPFQEDTQRSPAFAPAFDGGWRKSAVVAPPGRAGLVPATKAPTAMEAATLPAADGSDGRPLVAASAAVGQAEGPWEALFLLS